MCETPCSCQGSSPALPSSQASRSPSAGSSASSRVDAASSTGAERRNAPLVFCDNSAAWRSISEGNKIGAAAGAGSGCEENWPSRHLRASPDVLGRPVRHLEHTRCGSLPQPKRSGSTIALDGAHSSQQIKPQARQWWRRMMSEKRLSHIMHFEACSSGSQWVLDPIYARGI